MWFVMPQDSSVHFTVSYCASYCERGSNECSGAFEKVLVMVCIVVIVFCVYEQRIVAWNDFLFELIITNIWAHVYWGPFTNMV